MKNVGFRRPLLGVAFAVLLSIVAVPSHAIDAMTQAMESLLGPADFAQQAPVFTDLGDGFYSVHIPLTPKIQESLREAMGSRDEFTQKARAQSIYVISVGQSPVLPPNPIATTHGALSDTTYPYTYWVITLNLGSQTVTKTTTLKLNGPGLKFNRSINAVYGANGIWGIGYSPGAGVQKPGVYTLQGSVKDGGSITTKSFAINP